MSLAFSSCALVSGWAGAAVGGDLGAARVASASARAAAQSVSGALCRFTSGSRAASGVTAVASATAAPAFSASGPLYGPTSGCAKVPLAYSGERSDKIRAPLVSGRTSRFSVSRVRSTSPYVDDGVVGVEHEAARVGAAVGDGEIADHAIELDLLVAEQFDEDGVGHVQPGRLQDERS